MAAKNYFWDSCVFIRFLTGDATTPCLDDIHQFILDAKKGEARIYFSTIAYEEIRPRYLKEGDHSTVQEFFTDLGAAFMPIDPNPNIMISAGDLRDADPVNPNSREPNKRVVGTPDAVHLATAIYARDVLGISDIVFHTLDGGKGKSWEGKCVPLLNFERWFPVGSRSSLVENVCTLPRRTPIHPQPTLGAGLLTTPKKGGAQPSPPPADA